MNKSILFLPALAIIFSSCSLLNLVKESTAVIEANRDAVIASTDAIRRNHEAVEKSNVAIENNIVTVEKSNAAIEENRRKLEEINKYIEKIENWFSFSKDEPEPEK